MPFLIHKKTHQIACRIWGKNRGDDTPNPHNRKGATPSRTRSPPRSTSGASHLQSFGVGALRRRLSRFWLSENDHLRNKILVLN